MDKDLRKAIKIQMKSLVVSIGTRLIQSHLSSAHYTETLHENDINNTPNFFFLQSFVSSMKFTSGGWKRQQYSRTTCVTLNQLARGGFYLPLSPAGVAAKGLLEYVRLRTKVPLC